MNKIKPFLIIIALALLAPVAVLAHNPRIVDGEGIVEVKKPAISQAFYGQLKGQSQYFAINAEESLDLYVGLLVPDKAGAQTGITAEVIKVADKGREVIGVLDGSRFNWTTLHEPFGGDYYRKGPEYQAELPAGRYLIHVYSQNFNEKYALVIGQKESFSPSEIWNTLKTLPTLKKDFFEKSPWTAYFNYIGAMMLVALLILAAVVWPVYKLIKKQRS